MHETPAYTIEAPLLDPQALLGRPAPRHLKVTGASPAFGFERCEDPGCSVDTGGTASSCGRVACPVCGCGGTNLETVALLGSALGVEVRCSCGHAWVRGQAGAVVLAPLAASL